MVAQIEQSPESLGDQVESIYERLLQRQADPTGLTAFTTMLENGGTVEQVEAVIAGSTEYFQTRGGGTVAGYLDALYADALDRSVDSAGATGFSQAIAQGASREAVAAAVFSSAEYRQDLIQSYYETYLGRAADNGGLADCMAALQQGASDQALIAALLGSQEYMQKLL